MGIVRNANDVIHLDTSTSIPVIAYIAIVETRSPKLADRLGSPKSLFFSSESFVLICLTVSVLRLPDMVLLRTHCESLSHRTTIEIIHPWRRAIPLGGVSPPGAIWFSLEIEMLGLV